MLLGVKVRWDDFCKAFASVQYCSAPSSILTISGKTPVVCTTLSIVKVGTMSNFVSEDSVFSNRWPKAQSGVLLKRSEVLSEQTAGLSLRL